MGKIKYNFSTVVMLSTLLILIGTFFFAGCGKEEDEPLNENILNSNELEEYIIAGADFQKSLAIFTSELNKIDFSKLDFSYDTEGNKVRHLPAGSVSFRIEEKLHAFFEKRDALGKKFPHFSSFREEIGKKYFQDCIQSSVNLKSKLMELGYKPSSPLLKNGSEQYDVMENWVFLQSYLYSWLNSPGYQEVVLIFYADGTVYVYHSPNAYYDPKTNTYYTSAPPMTQSSNGNYYYTSGGSSTPVVGIAHTHKYSSNPSPGDGAVPGIPNSIYYNWGLHCYANCN